MSKKLTESDYIFDGFCERRFDPSIDGWRNAMPDPSMYPSVQAAQDTIALFEELQAARKRIWQLERELASLKGSAE